MRFILILNFVTWLMLFPGLTSAANWPSYYTANIQGWQVHVQQKLFDNDDPRLDRVMAFLNVKLHEAASVLPEQYLPALKQVPIWVSENTGDDVEYYFYKARILRGGFNPEKMGGIEIHNIDEFLDLIQYVPNVMIHELAHAFHKMKYQDIDKLIMRAYENAESNHLYRKPDQRPNYKAREVYAAKSPYEYFADISVMYFSENDYYPHDRDELKEYDPEGYSMVEKAWE